MPPTMLLDHLQGVRRKVRVLSILFGVGIVVAAAAGLLLATVLLDYMLNLPAIPRVIVILAALIVHEVAVDVGFALPAAFLVVMVVLTWIPVELFIALYLRDHRTLHRVERKPAAR